MFKQIVAEKTRAVNVRGTECVTPLTLVRAGCDLENDIEQARDMFIEKPDPDMFDALVCAIERRAWFRSNLITQFGRDR